MIAGLNFFSKKQRHAKVTMYSTKYCGYCVHARRLLEKKKISFEEIIIDNNRDLWLEMEERAKSRSVPQIFIDDKHVGGASDLYALEEAGELDTLLYTAD